MNPFHEKKEIEELVGRFKTYILNKNQTEA
jgi:hypothetical protein